MIYMKDKVEYNIQNFRINLLKPQTQNIVVTVIDYLTLLYLRFSLCL